MAKWNNNNKTTFTTSFKIECNESVKAFISRMLEDEKEHQEIFTKRIEQLFKEHITLDGGFSESVRNQLLQLFAVGYQLGWNDHCELVNEQINN